MPGYVNDDAEPYRPAALFWMDERGAVLGSTVGKPREVLGSAAASLQSAIEQPMIGRPHAPARVRVASAELALVLRDAHPSIEVVCAPTPEIDGLFAMLRDKLAEDSDAEQSYLAPGIDAAAVGSFFRAAAGLFRAAPWKVVPGDQDLFAVTIESLGLHEAAMSVIGQMGESLGLVLFSGFDDFAAFIDAADAIERGEEAAMPPHVSLNFERGADLGASMRKEIAEHRWVVAGADAYPWLVAVDEDLVARPPTSREIAIAEAIALALCKVLGDEKSLVRAWEGGEPIAHTVSVRTHAGDIDVMLRAPYERAVSDRPPFDVLTDLFELTKDGEEIDCDTRRALEDELVDAFVASPEALALADEVGSCRLVMDLAANYFGVTIATLGAAQLREVVFELIPRRVSMEAGEARAVVEENRAFFAFMKREYQLAQADACMRVLAGDAVKKLEAALCDPRKFGMAKSLLMTGRDAGFDMETKEGIEAWMRVAQGKPLPGPARGPALATASRRNDVGTATAKKNGRKQARKARKKNR